MLQTSLIKLDHVLLIKNLQLNGKKDNVVQTQKER